MTRAGTASRSRVAAVTRRGHHLKIAEAIEALRSEGNLPRHLRVVERNKRIVAWLNAHGYDGDLPSRSAIGRYFEAEQIGQIG
jgi:hypothetical protein